MPRAARRDAHALRETEAPFRALIEGPPVVIGVRRDGVNQNANPAYRRLFGFSSVDEIVGTPIVDRWPDLEVVLMSGYAEDEALREDVSLGKVRFLQKPIGFDALAREIRAALDDRPV